jgi:exoribonuclease-2
MLINGKDERSADNSLPEGSMICYEQDGAPQLAVVIAWRKSKYSVLNLRGQELDLTAERIHKLPGGLPPGCDSREARLSFLELLDKRAREILPQIDLEKAWSCCQQSGELDNSGITRRYFEQDSPAQHLAMRYALLAEQPFFKRKKALFEARPVETVEEMKRAAASIKRKQQDREQSLAFARARLENPGLPLPPAALAYLQLIEDIAVDSQNIDNNRKREAKNLMDSITEACGLQLSGSLPERAWQLLVRIGHFTEDQNPALIRNRMPPAFSEKALAEAESITIPADLSGYTAEDQLLREDLQDLDCMTIDDASTADMDDAISLRQIQDGYELGIHISDVSALIKPDSALEQEARARATSIYSPDALINMLPDSLAEQKLSLVEGQPRPAVSLFFQVDHGYRITASRICPSVIRVKRRLTYEQADHMLESGDSELGLIYNIASGCEAKRFEKGGFRVDKRDVNVVLGPDRSMKLVETDENAPSRRLIGELMVLANKTCAEFGIQHGLPLFFRSQEGPGRGLLQQIARVPEGPAADYALRYQLKKSIVAPTPAWHATLGLEAYAQCSSPIRRYSDLCNQRQILHFLRTSQKLYNTTQVSALIQQLEEPLKRATRLSRESKRFWLQQYLKQTLRRGEAIPATVLRTDYQNPLVELDIVFFSSPARVHSKVQPGDRINLRIEAIDPRYDVIRLEEV